MAAKRNEGEFVAPAVRDEFFRRLCLEPDNKVCADCPIKNPTWASATFGVLICMDCAAKHRRMGTHITFVRSIQLDEWTRAQLKVMELGGNARLNHSLQQHGFKLQAGAESKEKYTSRQALRYKQELHAKASKERQAELERAMASASVSQEPPAAQQAPTPQASAPAVVAAAPAPAPVPPQPTPTPAPAAPGAGQPVASAVGAQAFSFSTTKRVPTKKGVSVKKASADAFRNAANAPPQQPQAPAQPQAPPAPQQSQPAAQPAAPQPTPQTNQPAKPVSILDQAFLSSQAPAKKINVMTQKPVGNDFFAKWQSGQAQQKPPSAGAAPSPFFGGSTPANS